ncbi:MAG: 3-hydroxyacyl-CoA dehydrogenase NAD-binding domain-containing protein [Acidimicrobiales bacterium]
MTIKRGGIIGSGIMGSGIAEVVAKAGHEDPALPPAAVG